VIEDVALPDKRVYEGLGGTAAFLAFQAEIFTDTRVDVQEFIHAGDRLVAIVRIAGVGPSSGIAVAAEFGHIWSLVDGKAVHLRIVRDKSEALATVGLELPRFR
jgi:ketosteroid isomerase-like protein